jgi:anthranilate phosphoribosyltransferase
VLGGAKGAYRDTVLMNAGAGLVVAGKVAGIDEGVHLAARAIDEGAAARTLERLVAISNE